MVEQSQGPNASTIHVFVFAISISRMQPLGGQKTDQTQNLLDFDYTVLSPTTVDDQSLSLLSPPCLSRSPSRFPLSFSVSLPKFVSSESSFELDCVLEPFLAALNHNSSWICPLPRGGTLCAEAFCHSLTILAEDRGGPHCIIKSGGDCL